MKIYSILGNLYQALVKGRRKGFSTEMQKIAESREDVLIICPDERSAKRFGDKGISMYQLENLHLYENKLFLLDNHTLLQVLKDAQDDLTSQGHEINRSHRLIKRIEESIEAFKNTSVTYENNYKSL